MDTRPTGRNIVAGQKVDRDKVQRAKGFRHSMTEEEWILWQHLRGHRLLGLHFRRQQVIDGFIVDFYCHAAGLVIEVDGPVHDERAEYDLERDRILARRGLRILRIRNEELVENVSAVVARIASLLESENLSRDLIDLASARSQGHEESGTAVTSSLPSPRGGGAGGGVFRG